MKIVLATHNRDKAREIGQLLSGLDVTCLTLDAFPDAPTVTEDGLTLEENALKKASAIHAFTGLTALADDTGLEVEALGGAPGIYAARYAGENATYADNCNKLVAAMCDVPDGRRGAQFRTVIAVVPAGAGAEVLQSEGILHGEITRKATGAGGFGYDPVFRVLSSGRTLAEMSTSEKNAVSHRYRALIEMRELMLRLGWVTEVPA